MTDFTGRQNYKINKKISHWFTASDVSVVHILAFFSHQHDTFSLLSVSVLYSTLLPHFTLFIVFCSISCPLTSLSWLVMVSRVTGLLGLLLSLTEATCPFLMIGTVASAWPGVWGWGTAWPCPPEEANFEPSVKYCLTCWFWVWWRWNLEFSRWLCTCGEKKKHPFNSNFLRKTLLCAFFSHQSRPHQLLYLWLNTDNDDEIIHFILLLLSEKYQPQPFLWLLMSKVLYLIIDRDNNVDDFFFKNPSLVS